MELPAYFEALMNRAPIPPSDIATYLREMRQTPNGPLITSKLLAGKIQATSEAQALHAFEFLEAALESECEGSIEFRTEIGRYRFLNEIIRILSPKYLGNQTAMSVKDRAIRFLADAAGAKKQRWFPSEHSKIILVYQSLIDSGIIKPAEDSCEDAAEAELQKSIFDRAENAAALKKLLTSKDPADLQAANRLIKNLVDEEAKRNERRAELHSLIDRIDTTTSLLTEMLNQTNRDDDNDDDDDSESNSGSGSGPGMDKELVDDLADTCRTLRLKLGAVATETGDEASSLLQASENIESALQLYEDRKQLKPKRTTQTTTTASRVHRKNVDLLGDPGSGTESTVNKSCSGTGLTLADELLMGISEDFAMVTTSGSGSSSLKMTTTASKRKDSENLLLNFDVEIKGRELRGQGHQEEGQTTLEVEDKRVNSFSEIERMSRELLEEGLKNSKGNHHLLSQQLMQTQTQPKIKNMTLSQLQNNSSSNSNSPLTSLTQTQVTPAFVPLTLTSLELNGSGSGSGDMGLLDLDFLDKSNQKPKPEELQTPSSLTLATKGQSVNVNGPSSSPLANTNALLNFNGPNGDGNGRKSWPNSNVEDDSLLLPLEEDEKKEKDKGSDDEPLKGQSEGEGPGSTSRSKSKKSQSQSESLGGSFSLKEVKTIDLEEIEFIEDVEPIDLNLMVETDSGPVKCKQVGLTLTFGLLPQFPTNVHVVVITLTNRSSSLLINYVFQLLPPKGMQVKLLSPSCIELPPWKKCFLPPPLLTQVAVLVVLPSSGPLPPPPPLGSGSTGSQKMRFILSYCLGEDSTELHNGHFDLPSYLYQNQKDPDSSGKQQS